MIGTDEKAAFIENLPNAQLILIGKEDADGITFKNSDHGLGLDFFKFFEMIMPMLDGMFADRAYCLNLPKEVLLGTDDAKIHITYERGLPELMEISFPE